MSKPKKDCQTNGYADEDFRNVLDEIEGYVDEQASIRAEAAGRCGGLAKKIKNAKATAKALGIPLAVLGASLKARKLERQLQAIADDIPEDLIEVWVDAAGQFAWLPPDEDEPKASPAKKAAKRAKSAADANAEQEQIDGAAVIDGLAGQTEAVH